MKFTLLQISFLATLFLFQSNALLAQDGSAYATEKEEDGKKLHFNGLGRTVLSQTSIDGDILNADSTTVGSLTDGEFLLDLAVNATPNKQTEVQAILRLRNEFGGFFGSGISVEVRELWARGIIADVLKYRVGDMDVVMSPYTFFNNNEEGTINEPALFAPQKEVVYYEQFYGDNNSRRMQGAKLDFGLDFTQVLKDADFNAFIARVRATDFFTVPTRFVTGGQAQFATRSLQDTTGLQADFGINVVHTYDDLRSGQATNGIRNTVYTFNFDVSILDNENFALNLVGETGMSNLEFKDDSISVFKEDDSFLDVGLQANLKAQKLSLSASFIDIGPDFFSIGAQSKRVDFNANKSYYNRLGTDRALRMPSLFDLSRDRAMYTFQLSDRLMPYDPRFSNTMPYGTATPNRRGLKFGITYGGAEEKVEVKADAAILNEIRGQGTTELKSFALLRGAATFNFHQMASWEKALRLTLGYQYEQTSRNGLEVEQIDLSSNLLEVGIEAELFPKFELLLGAKLLSAEGSDYVPLIESYNDVQDFPVRLSINDQETLIGAGLKYNFKEGIYLTLQYHSFQSQLGTNNPNDYNFNQVFAIYSMNF